MNLLKPIFIGLAFVASFGALNLEAAESEHHCVLTQDLHAHTELDQLQMKIADIEVRVKPIFDNPGSGLLGWVYSTANQLHIQTRESVVRKDLLFQKGDLLRIEQLAATERRLRGRRYYADASVSLDPACGDGARVIVEVREVWTLEPTLQFSKAGNNSSFGFGLEETNLLGLGTTIAIARYSDDFREGTLVKYTDPNTGWYHSEFDLRLADNSDGHVRQVRLTKPFLALDTPWAAGLSLRSIEQDDRLFQETNEVDIYQRETNSLGVFFGALAGSVENNRVRRWLAGYQWVDQKYLTSPDTLNIGLLPRNTRISYPWIELQWLEQRFIETRNLEEMNRVEDINLGLDGFLRAGWTQSSQTDLSDRLSLGLGVHQYLSFGIPHTFKWHISFNGFVDVGTLSDVRDGLAGVSLSYFWRPDFFNDLSQTFIRFSDDRVFRPEGNRYLSVGGNSGSRGYPSRYFFGDRRQVVNLEQRFFGQREYHSLVYIGSALFYDAAHVWGQNATGLQNSGWLQSAGFGLRISTNRLGGSDGGGNSTLHVDFAVPIDAALPVDSSQFLITVKKSF